MRQLLLLAIFFSALCFSEEEENPIIFHHVNVITGDLNLVVEEARVEGAVPLTIQRTYTSAGALERDKHDHDLYLKDLHHGFLIQGGWSLFSHAYMLFVPAQPGHSTLAYVADRFGAVTTYEYCGCEGESLLLKPKTSSAKTFGKISGKSNRALNLLKVNSSSGDAILTLSDGTRCTYLGPTKKERKKKDPLGIAFFYLMKEELPSQSHILYEYDRKDRLTKVKVTNKKEDKVFSSCEFALDKPRTPYNFSLSTSDGKSFDYQFKDINHRDYLIEAKSSGGLSQGYDYTKDRRGIGARISEIALDGDVQYRITYHNMTSKEKDKFYRDASKKPFRVDKVEKIEAPFGPSGEYIPIATFEYTEGVTKVRDAEGLLIHFFYENQKPSLIVYHDENELPASYTKFLWKEDNMICKMKLDKESTPLFSKTFVYDEFGNVIKETFWGNITGAAKDPFEEGPFGLLVNAEHSSKTFRYEGDMQLLVEEKEDSGLSYIYSYLEGTSLLTKKLTLFREKILLREFHEYDSDCLLSCQICDDGTELDIDDLSGVTERKIIRYKRDNKSGLASEIKHLYLDLQTHEETPLQRQELSYGPSKRVIEEMIFDREGSYKYSIKKKYNAQGLITEQTTPTGQKNSYDYDTKGRLVFCKEVGSLAKKHHYDRAQRLSKEEEIDKKGGCHKTVMSYDVKGRLLKKTDPLGHSVVQRYDSFGRCIRSETTPIQEKDGVFYTPTVFFSYDSDGNLSLSVNPKNESYLTEYNSLRKPTIITAPDGSITSHRYDMSGSIVETIHPDGTREVFTLDPFKRITNKKIIGWDDELLQEEHWNYGTFHLLSYTDPVGLTTTYTYDGSGRIIKEQQEDRIRRYEYDSLGHLERSYVSDTCTVEIHDVAGKIMESWTESPHFSKENWMSFVYDEEDCKVAAYRMTGKGKTKDVFSYDEKLRLSSHTNPLGQTWLYSHSDEATDQNGQRIHKKITTDPLLCRLVETFDAQGRIHRKEKLDENSSTLFKEEIFYDKAGNKEQNISYVFHKGALQRQHTVSWQYDPCGRVIEENEEGQRIKTFCYDSRGRLIKKHLGSSSELFFDYDGLGRITELYSSDGQIHYTYHYYKGSDPIFLKDEVAGDTIERLYNIFGELLSETSSSTLSYAWQYDHLGRCTAFTLPDGSLINYDYKDHHMTKVKRQKKDGTTYHHTYDHFDTNGHVEQESAILSHGTMHSDRDMLERVQHLYSPFHSCTNTFDKNGRVIEALNSLTGDRIYDYDGLGQLTKENDHKYNFDSMGNPVEAVVGACNELLSTSSLDISYDEEGRTTGKKTEEGSSYFEYDALCRLKSITKPSGEKVCFYYDASSRLVKKVGQGEEISYLHDKNVEIGTISLDGNIRELRVLGLGIQGDIGACISIEIAEEIYLPLHDTAGNIIAIVGSDGAVREKYTFNTFGNSEQSSSSFINPWRFSSKRAEEDLVFFGLRFYDPQIGRWLTPDPAGFADSVNVYLFVFNAPTNRLDLFGLSADPLYPFPDIRIDAPLPVLLAEPTFANVQNFKGSIDGVEVDWLIKGGNWSKLSFSSEELTTGRVNLFHHFQEVMPSEGQVIGLVSFQNGIQTTLTEAAEMVNRISSWSPENTLVLSLYNPSSSFFSDVKEATQEIMQWKETQMSALTRQYFTAMSTSLCKINPEAFWLHIAHSRGGGIATRAIEGMSAEQKEQMRKNFLYLGVASSIPMPKQFCAQSLNIYSEFDRITGRFGRKLIEHPDYNIEIIKCITPLQDRILTPLFADHAFLGETYQQRTQWSIDAFHNDLKVPHENTR